MFHQLPAIAACTLLEHHELVCYIKLSFYSWSVGVHDEEPGW
jgi:hypothetical protein